MKRIMLFLLIDLAFVAASHGGEVQDSKGRSLQTSGPATLELRFNAGRPQISLSDVITAELRIEGTSDLRVDIPTSVPNGWTIVEPLPLAKEPVGKDRLRWRLITKFAPDHPGAKVTFTYPEVTFTDGKKRQSIKFVPVDFVVTTQISNPDISQLRDKPEIEMLPPMDVNDGLAWYWLALGGAILTLILTFLFARYYWRRPVPQSAAELAMKEWNRLIALQLPEKGQAERFITLLTLLVRQYLERQYSVPARRRTTPEFLRQLEQIRGLTDSQRTFLTSFLERCEQIKFAKATASIDECSQLAEAARQFINSWRQD